MPKGVENCGWISCSGTGIESVLGLQKRPSLLCCIWALEVGNTEVMMVKLHCVC